MKKKNILCAVALTSLLLGGLTSCGDNPTTNTQTAGPTSAEPTTSQSGDALNIEFWGTFNKGFADSIETVINEFEQVILEKEGKKVNFNFTQQGGYGDVEDKVIKGFNSNVYPTICVAYPDAVSNFLATDKTKVAEIGKYFDDPKIGFGKDLAELDDDVTKEDYVAAFLDEGTHYAQEGTYSFPFLKSTEIMAYNKELVETIQIPGLNDGRPLTEKFMSNITWDEFVTVLQYVKDNNEGDDGFKVKWPLFYDSDSNLFITKLMQNNVPFLANGDSGSSKVLFNNDQAKAEIGELVDLAKKGLITTKGVEGVYGNTYFTKGEVLFDICSSGGASYLDLGASSNISVVKVPYDNAPSYVSQGPTLAFLKHPNDPQDEEKLQYAFRLVKYLTNVENNALLAVNSGGYIPVNQRSYTTGTYEYYLYDETQAKSVLSINARAVIEQVKGSYYNLPNFKGSSAIRDYVGDIITSTFSNKKTVDEAFENAYNNSVLACN